MTALWWCNAAMSVRVRRKRWRDASNSGSKGDGGLGGFDKKLQGQPSCCTRQCPRNDLTCTLDVCTSALRLRHVPAARNICGP